MKDGQVQVEVENVKQEETFEENLQDLEEIVNQLETGEIPLEEAITQFQKEWRFLKICRKPWSLLKRPWSKSCRLMAVKQKWTNCER